jgi:hypothetical protein
MTLRTAAFGGSSARGLPTAGFSTFVVTGVAVRLASAEKIGSSSSGPLPSAIFFLS